MRKSERPTRKPDFLTFSDSKNRLGEENEMIESDEESDIDFEAQGIKKTTKRKAERGKDVPSKAKKQKGNDTSKAAIIEDPEGDATDLIAMIDRQRYQSFIDQWLKAAKSNRVEAINILMNLNIRAAGSNKDWIALDTDLEPLGPDELDELLAGKIEDFAANAGSKSYPLSQRPRGKTALPFRDKFQTFWKTLVTQLWQAAQDNPVSQKTYRTLLRVLMDILISFSSMALFSLRDVMTEACLSMGVALLDICRELKQREMTSSRQLGAAEREKEGRSSSSGGLVKLRQESRQLLQEAYTLVNTIFHSVYMHRSRDSHDEIRLHCVTHLSAFIAFDLDPAKRLKEEYLKYLGYACSDTDGNVRITAIDRIKELLEQDDLSEYLTSFVEHFMARFIQIGAKDIDQNVSLEMISALRVMQRQGFLDSVSEEQLDVIDKVVFDHEASLDLRREALLFLMDHTEGFDDSDPALLDSLLEERDLASGGRGQQPHTEKKSKGTAASKDKDKDGKDHKEKRRRKHIALQLETLTEFAEHHLGARVIASSLLGEAILHSAKAELLYDWSTILALLMRDTDELISQALRPNQVGILLTLFVTSAKKVFEERNQMMLGSSTASISRKVSTADATAAYERWESLNSLLHRRIVSLLSRFQDNEQHLAILTELLQYMEINGHGQGQGQVAVGMGAAGGGWMEIERCLEELVAKHSQEKMLRHIVEACKTWQLLRQGHLAMASSSSSSSSGQGGSGGSNSNSSSHGRKKPSGNNKSKISSSSSLLDDPSSSLLAPVHNVARQLWTNLSSQLVPQLTRQVQAVEKAMDKTLESSGSGGQATKGRRESHSQTALNNAMTTFSDLVKELSLSLFKLKVFFEMVDLRKVQQAGGEGGAAVLPSEEIQGLVQEVVQSLLAFYEVIARQQPTGLGLLSSALGGGSGSSNKGSNKEVEELGRDLVQVISQATSLLLSCILWSYREIFDLQLQKKKTGDKEGQKKEEEEEAQPREVREGEEEGEEEVEQREALIREKIQTMLGYREGLVDSCLALMKLSESAVSVNAAAAAGRLAMQIKRQLPLEGFRIISILRAFFPLREQKYALLEDCVYLPSEDILYYLKTVFEVEEQLLSRDLLAVEQGGGEGEDEEEGHGGQGNKQQQIQIQRERALTRSLLQNLLLPLSRSLIFDIEHLNRRQAAAVLQYIIHPSSQVQETIKFFAKRLKEGNAKKFMEVHLAALKLVFNQEVLATVTARETMEAALEATEEENAAKGIDEEALASYDAAASKQQEVAGYEKLTALAKRLSVSVLAVGRLRGNADLVAAVVAFLKAGLDYMLSSRRHVGFASALSQYLRLLDEREQQEVGRYWEERCQDEETLPWLEADLQEIAAMAEQDQDQQEEVTTMLNPAYRSYLELQHLLHLDHRALLGDETVQQLHNASALLGLSQQEGAAGGGGGAAGTSTASKRKRATGGGGGRGGGGKTAAASMGAGGVGGGAGKKGGGGKGGERKGAPTNEKDEEETARMLLEGEDEEEEEDLFGLAMTAAASTKTKKGNKGSATGRGAKTKAITPAASTAAAAAKKTKTAAAAVPASSTADNNKKKKTSAAPPTALPAPPASRRSERSQIRPSINYQEEDEDEIEEEGDDEVAEAGYSRLSATAARGKTRREMEEEEIEEDVDEEEMEQEEEEEEKEVKPRRPSGRGRRGERVATATAALSREEEEAAEKMMEMEQEEEEDIGGGPRDDIDLTLPSLPPATGLEIEEDDEEEEEEETMRRRRRMMARQQPAATSTKRPPLAPPTAAAVSSGRGGERGDRGGGSGLLSPSSLLQFAASMRSSSAAVGSNSYSGRSYGTAGGTVGGGGGGSNRRLSAEGSASLLSMSALKRVLAPSNTSSSSSSQPTLLTSTLTKPPSGRGRQQLQQQEEEEVEDMLSPILPPPPPAARSLSSNQPQLQQQGRLAGRASSSSSSGAGGLGGLLSMASSSASKTSSRRPSYSLSALSSRRGTMESVAEGDEEEAGGDEEEQEEIDQLPVSRRRMH